MSRAISSTSPSSAPPVARSPKRPALPQGTAPPAAVTVVERGAENPPATIANDTVLISREEIERLAAAISAEIDRHRFARDQRCPARRRGIPAAALDRRAPRSLAPPATRIRPSPGLSRTSARACEIRTGPVSPLKTDIVAATIIAAFRDLFASWVHHPLFGAMVNTAAAQGFSLHAMALFGAAKSLASAGNRVGFVPTLGPRPRIVSFQVVYGAAGANVGRRQPFRPVRVAGRTAGNASDGPRRGDRGNGIGARQHQSPAARDCWCCRRRQPRRRRTSVARRHQSRGRFAWQAQSRPGGGGGDLSQGRTTGRPREVRFGHAFYPIPNRNHSVGRSVRVGSRADHDGVG